jgi:hypothetical protein
MRRPSCKTIPCLDGSLRIAFVADRTKVMAFASRTCPNESAPKRILTHTRTPALPGLVADQCGRLQVTC